MRDEVAQLLADDFEVIGVPDGAVALQAAHEHLPELVISDLAMPQIDGAVLLAALRGDQRTSSMPVIFVVERPGTAKHDDGSALEPDGYLGEAVHRARAGRARAHPPVL